MHLNKYINNLSDKKITKGASLLDKLTILSDQTSTQDIDEDRISVIEINKSGKVYNIKNSFENDLFWYTYDNSDEIKNISLILSCVSFSMGFLLLGYIFIQNLMFVISKI